MVELHEAINQNVAKGATLFTDQWVAYRGLKLSYKHSIVITAIRNMFAAKFILTALNRFGPCSNAHHWRVSPDEQKHMQKYVDECAFR